jgi:hypothetical protein
MVRFDMIDLSDSVFLSIKRASPTQMMIKNKSNRTAKHPNSLAYK